MDAGSVIILVLWAWGAYKGWNTLTGKIEWLDRKQPVSYIVKGAVCVLLGIVFAIWQIARFAFRLAGIVI